MKTKILFVLFFLTIGAEIPLTTQAQGAGSSIDMSDNNPPASSALWTFNNDVYTLLDGAA